MTSLSAGPLPPWLKLVVHRHACLVTLPTPSSGPPTWKPLDTRTTVSTELGTYVHTPSQTQSPFASLIRFGSSPKTGLLTDAQLEQPAHTVSFLCFRADHRDSGFSCSRAGHGSQCMKVMFAVMLSQHTRVFNLKLTGICYRSSYNQIFISCRLAGDTAEMLMPQRIRFSELIPGHFPLRLTGRFYGSELGLLAFAQHIREFNPTSPAAFQQPEHSQQPLHVRNPIIVA